MRGDRRGFRGGFSAGLLVLGLSGCALFTPKPDTRPEPVAAAPVASVAPTRERMMAALREGGLEVEARGLGIVVLLPGSLFTFGSSDLAISAGDNIRDLAAVLNSNYAVDRRIVVEGHTDSLGSAEYNLELSRWRAEAVRDELVFSGVPRSRIDIAWYGESRPIAPNTLPDGRDNPAGRERNRRVEILVQEPRQ